MRLPYNIGDVLVSNYDPDWQWLVLDKVDDCVVFRPIGEAVGHPKQDETHLDNINYDECALRQPSNWTITPSKPTAFTDLYTKLSQ
jgi:hypothetical protein